MKRSVVLLIVLVFVLGTVTILPTLAQDDNTITVYSNLGDQDGERFETAVAAFEEATGVDVIIETSQDLGLLSVRAEGGNLPDTILFPQPGLMADFARDGHLVPLNDIIDMDKFLEDYSQTWVDLGSVDSQLYAIPYRVNVKSLVWYAADDFAANGYGIPETWEELDALAQQIIADGGVPWCLGIESGGASGWPGTDWIEDLMLRTAGTEAYDQWVAGELKFDSPEVRRAFDIFGEIALSDEMVLGGPIGALSTFFGDAPLPMFEDPPGCWMLKQASFIAGYLPEEVSDNLDEEWNAFYLPPIDEEAGRPVLGSGNMIVITNEREEVKEFANFMTTPEAYESWLKEGNFISANRSIPMDWYPDDLIRLQADILLNADNFRFDGSDLMPGEVGTGSFWSEMVNWISGQDLDTTLQNIDSSWPSDE